MRGLKGSQIVVFILFQKEAHREEDLRDGRLKERTNVFQNLKRIRKNKKRNFAFVGQG